MGRSRKRCCASTAHRRQGWETVARSLGIKPGSAAFHALKEGALDWHPGSRHSKGKDDGHGHGNKHRK
jgi:hypothetical protein